MEKLKLIENKIISTDSLQERLAYWKFKEQKIVFTNGCFDIIHQGHIDYLSKARDLGDILIVGLNTDNSVKRLKGNHRPINDEKSRALILSSFLFVDVVIFFNEDTPYELIKTIQPDILVKGSDYKAEEIIGYDIVKAKGGKVETLDFLPGFSTSGIEKKIIESSQKK